MAVLIDHVLVLRHREIIFLAGLFDFQSGGNPRRRGSAKQIRVEARPRADTVPRGGVRSPGAASRELSAWPGTSTRPPSFRARRAAASRNRPPPVPAVAPSRADHHRVVPRQLRDGLRQFLQPAVIREAPVADRRVRPERRFPIPRCGCAFGTCWAKSAAQRHGNRRQRRPSHHAVVQRRLPERFERLVFFRTLALPVIPHDIVPGLSRVSA